MSERGVGDLYRDEKEEEISTKFADGSDDFKKALAHAQKWHKKYPTADAIPEDEIPKNYTFKNIDGYNFMQPIRDQAACGSCYTTSFV